MVLQMLEVLSEGEMQRISRYLDLNLNYRRCREIKAAKSLIFPHIFVAHISELCIFNMSRHNW